MHVRCCQEEGRLGFRLGCDVRYTCVGEINMVRITVGCKILTTAGKVAIWGSLAGMWMAMGEGGNDKMVAMRTEDEDFTLECMEQRA